MPSLPSSPGMTKAAGVGDRSDREGISLLLVSTGLSERWEKKWGKDLLDHKALQRVTCYLDNVCSQADDASVGEMG